MTATATEVPLDPTPTEKPGSDLRDTIWVLAGYLADFRDEELTGPIQDVEVNLLLDEDDTFNGFAGCNTYNGRYVTDGKQIIFDGFMITQAICELPEGIMDQEVLYLSLLESVEEYRFNDVDQLELIRYMIKENNEREEKILLFFDGLRAEQW